MTATSGQQLSTYYLKGDYFQIDLVTSDLRERPAIPDPKISYWYNFAILGEDFGCTLFKCCLKAEGSNIRMG